MKRAACPSNSWKATWWCSSPMPLRSRCPGSALIWRVLPLSLKVLAASPFSLSCGLSVPCLMLWTQLHRGWKVEVGQASIHHVCLLLLSLVIRFLFSTFLALMSDAVAHTLDGCEVQPLGEELNPEREELLVDMDVVRERGLEIINTTAYIAITGDVHRCSTGATLACKPQAWQICKKSVVWNSNMHMDWPPVQDVFWLLTWWLLG